MRKTPESVETFDNAEAAFRAAFERLKADCPVILSRGTLVSQNNVAREAGCDPSALRKSRYPELIAEIRTWISASGGDQRRSDARKKMSAKKATRRSQNQLIADLKSQRDRLASLLVEADAKILDLTLELARLRPSSKVSPIRK